MSHDVIGDDELRPGRMQVHIRLSVPILPAMAAAAIALLRLRSADPLRVHHDRSVCRVPAKPNPRKELQR